MSNDESITLADAIIKPPAAYENEIQAAIKAFLRHLGFESETRAVASGEVDIYLPNNNLVIETKDRGKVNPDGPGSRSDETQEQQLERYVTDLHTERVQQLIQTPNHNWRGLLTDGVDWYLYEWSDDGSGRLKLTNRETNHPPIYDPQVLIAWLPEFVSRVQKKLDLPDDLYGVFERSQQELRRIYGELADSQGTQTKFALWRDMMQGSGFEVGGSAEDLFINHTLLVTIAEAVIATLNDDQRDPTDILNDGFASWPQDRGSYGPMHPRGAQWVEDVFDIADTYDWRSRERDVLRVLYQEIIDPRHRKSFGEYYTPDWLAQVVIEEVIDDTWLDNAIQVSLSDHPAAPPSSTTQQHHPAAPPSGIGVLDPACGSGTFLYHVARKILQSSQLKRQHLSDAEAGAVVARLVNGFDIHPVAVSIARATLLRALPPGSVKSLDELRVWQGDSLMLNRGMGSLFNPENRVIEVSTPQGRLIAIPLSFAELPSFASELRRIVAAAQSNQPLPYGIGRDLDSDTQRRIAELHSTLSQVCAEEGDSVWTWYLANYAAPFILARTGVDRIVSNPPWVRMSDIQVFERKHALETRIRELDLSAGGKNATGFDIAGLFVAQCREHYLKSDAPVAGWVLNWGSMKAGNWAQVRDKQNHLTATYLDFSKVKEPPFTGAKACVWIQRGSTNRLPSTRLYNNLKRAQRVNGTDGFYEFRAKTDSKLHIKSFPDAPSDYSNAHGRSFAQGAIITPTVLLKLSKINAGTVTTTKSRHLPWSALSTQSGSVPPHYLRPTLFSSDLLVFGCAGPTLSIIPLTVQESPDFAVDEDGSFDFRRGQDEFWNRLNELYEHRRGKGKATPKTLWEQLNFQNKLMKQLEHPLNRGNKVAYNTSGQVLRAARIAAGTIIESGCYYLAVSDDEGAYLASMLNAPCMQMAFQEARESDRHFHLHPLEKVAIPQFDPNDPDHLELAELCKLGEIASKEIIDTLPSSTGQIKASKLIRMTLISEGIADAIDDSARRVLPSHSVARYSDQYPHPWK